MDLPSNLASELELGRFSCLIWITMVAGPRPILMLVFEYAYVSVEQIGPRIWSSKFWTYNRSHSLGTVLDGSTLCPRLDAQTLTLSYRKDCVRVEIICISEPSVSLT